METDVLIIGGGISGLSTGHYLAKNGCNNFMILEKAARTGGKVQTIREDGFVIEEGPDSLISTKPAARELITELGLEDEIIYPTSKGFYILHGKKLYPSPEGLTGFVPGRLIPFLKSPLFSLSGKLRILMEPLKPVRIPEHDETVGEFIRRRFGSEMLDKFAGPLLSGIYASSAEKLSLMATFPQFRAMEEKYGSLSRAMLLNSSNNAGGNKHMFYSLKNGTGTLTEKLTQSLSNHIRTNTGVKQIISKGKEGPYEIITEGNEHIKAQSVVLATPAHISHQLLNDWLPEMAETLKRIPYVSTAVISMAFKKEDAEHPLNGTGFLIPEHENNFISSCTWTSSKWPHRCPDDHILLRCFFGRLGDQDILKSSDDELYNHAKTDLENILGIKKDARKYWIRRWNKAMPQYFPGHLEKLYNLKEVVKDHPFLFITGAGYKGLGIPDCIKHAKLTAEEVVELLDTV